MDVAATVDLRATAASARGFRIVTARRHEGIMARRGGAITATKRVHGPHRPTSVEGPSEPVRERGQGGRAGEGSGRCASPRKLPLPREVPDGPPAVSTSSVAESLVAAGTGAVRKRDPAVPQ